METTTLAATPPMGWNSWNQFGSRIHESSLRETADALVATGLKDLGYEYLVIDDCWSVKSGRDADGNLVADPEKFPGGMAALCDYVHTKGLKIGIYSDAAEKTCAGYPGSLGFEAQDAALWASWGFDFLKYDYCSAPDDQAIATERYAAMGAALRGTGREFLFSMCEWGGRAPHLFGRGVGAQMWRVTGDIFDSWVDVWMQHGDSHGYYGVGIDSAFDTADRLAEYAGAGAWNDLDMLVVGLKGKGAIGGGGLSFLEYQTHMSLWCLACSPLMIGCDLRIMDEQTLSLLTNPEVLAVNQDPLGKVGRRVARHGDCETWRKPLADGSMAVALFNRGSSGANVKLRAADIGLLDTPKAVRNLWKREDVADLGREATFRVQPHETILLSVRGL